MSVPWLKVRSTTLRRSADIGLARSWKRDLQCARHVSAPCELEHVLVTLNGPDLGGESTVDFGIAFPWRPTHHRRTDWPRRCLRLWWPRLGFALERAVGETQRVRQQVRPTDGLSDDVVGIADETGRFLPTQETFLGRGRQTAVASHPASKKLPPLHRSQ